MGLHGAAGESICKPLADEYQQHERVHRHPKDVLNTFPLILRGKA